MSIPQELQGHIDRALDMVRGDSQHDFNPVDRRDFTYAFKAVLDARAERAWRWLAVVTAHHLMPLYVTSRRASQDEIPLEAFATFVEDLRYAQAHEAVTLAIRVLEGKFDAEEALTIASNMHYVVGGDPTMPLQSWFIEMAANKALTEVTSDYDLFRLEWGLTPPDKLTYRDWKVDTAGTASIAWSCVVDSTQVDSADGGASWNWWTKHPQRDPARLLEFWGWWLTTAIPAAWELASAQPGLG